MFANQSRLSFAWRRWVARAVSVGGLSGVLLGMSCSDRRTQQQCYARDASLDYTGNLAFKPFCDWDDGLPEPPQGTEYTWKVTACFEPTDDKPCDPCDVERFDALLKAKIEERCDQPWDGFTRGCYVPPEEQTEGYCCAHAIYFSNCLAPEVD